MIERLLTGLADWLLAFRSTAASSGRRRAAGEAAPSLAEACTARLRRLAIELYPVLWLDWLLRTQWSDLS